MNVRLENGERIGTVDVGAAGAPNTKSITLRLREEFHFQSQTVNLPVVLTPVIDPAIQRRPLSASDLSLIAPDVETMRKVVGFIPMAKKGATHTIRKPWPYDTRRKP